MKNKVKNILGEVFGRLVVIEFDKIINNRARWWCYCDPNLGGCGNKKSILSGNLMSGDIVSCGCYKKELNSRKRTESLIGKRFGILIVKEEAEDYIYPSSGARGTQYLCECDCGEKIVVLAQRLRDGITTNCGCLRHKILDISGKRFGMLVALKVDYIDKHSGAFWLCNCDCGNITVVSGTRLRLGGTFSCGCLRESLIASELKKWAKYFFQEVVFEYKIVRNPETNNWLKFDIYVPYGRNPNLNGFYIEVHGGQHYKYIPHWHKSEEGFKNQNKRDSIKRKFAKKNGTYIEIDLRKIRTINDSIEYIKSIVKI